MAEDKTDPPTSADDATPSPKALVTPQEILTEHMTVTPDAVQRIKLIIDGGRAYEDDREADYEAMMYGTFAETTGYKVIFTALSSDKGKDLQVAVTRALRSLEKTDHPYTRYENGFSRSSVLSYYVIENKGEVGLVDSLTVDEVLRLYKRLCAMGVVRPTAQIARELETAVQLEMRSPVEPGMVESAFHPMERLGNYTALDADAVFGATVDDLRALFATHEISATQLRDHALVLGLHVLSGNITDPAGHFLPLDEILRLREVSKPLSKKTALVRRFSPQEALAHPEIASALPEIVHSTTENILRAVTDGNMGTDLSENAYRVFEWRSRLGNDTLAAASTQWDEQRETAQRSVEERWASGTFKKDFEHAYGEAPKKDASERKAGRADQKETLGVTARRGLANLLPKPQFLERDYSGNANPDETPLTAEEKQGLYHSRLPHSITLPRRELPAELEALLAQDRSQEARLQHLLTPKAASLAERENERRAGEAGGQTRTGSER